MNTKSALTLALPPSIITSIVHDFGGITTAQQYVSSCRCATITEPEKSNMQRKALYLRTVLGPLLQGKVRLDDIPLPRVRQLMRPPVHFDEMHYILADSTGEQMLAWTPAVAAMSANSWPPSRLQAAEKLAAFFETSGAIFVQLHSPPRPKRKTASSSAPTGQIGSQRSNTDILFNYAGFSGLITNLY